MILYNNGKSDRMGFVQSIQKKGAEAMHWDAELNYLQRMLGKMRLQTLRVSAAEVENKVLDLGLRSFLGLEGSNGCANH